MLVKLGVAVEFGRVLATPARISFSPFLGQTGFFLLFQCLLRLLPEFVLDLRLMLTQQVILLCPLCLNEPSAFLTGLTLLMLLVQASKILRY